MARKLIPLLVLGALAIPATASASTICVTPATGCVSSAPTISNAIMQASATPATRDTIELGAQEYPEQVTIPVGAQIDLVGQGVSTSIAPAAPVGTIVDDQDTASTVQNLNIRIKGGTSVTALGLSGSADGVSITADPNAVSPTGVSPSMAFPVGGSFRHGSITLPLTATSGGTGVAPGFFGPSTTVEDSTLQAPQGVSGSAIVRRSKIVAAVGAGSPPTGVLPSFAPTVETIEDTVIKTQAITGYSPAIGINSRSTIGPAIVLPSIVYARHDTIVGDGGSGSIGIVANATSAFASGGSAVADARNVIVSGFEHSLARSGYTSATPPFPPDAPAAITIAYSDFDPSTVQSTGPGAYQPSNNVSADPRFADTDFRLAPSSPAIDAGDPAGLAAGIAADPVHSIPAIPDEGATDRDGNARIVDGNRDGSAVTDMGAYEAATPAPPVPPAPVVPAAPSIVSIGSFKVTNKVFAVAAKATAVSAGAAKVKRGTVFSYLLSRPASVTISLAQKTTGFKKGTKCVAKAPKGKKKHCTLYKSKGTLKRSGAAGLNRVSFSGRVGKKALKPGTYRATIVATDAAGKSAPRTVAFKIVKG